MKNMPNTNVNKVRSSDIEFKDRLVSIQRVTKVTKGGRTFSFSAIVVVETKMELLDMDSEKLKR